MAEKPMKILFVSHSSQIGGATRSLMYLLKTIRKEDYTLIVPNYGPILDTYKRNGIDFILCNVPALFYSQYSKIKVSSLVRFIFNSHNVFTVFSYIINGYSIIYFNEIVFAPVVFILKMLFGNRIKIIVHSRVSMPIHRIGISRKIFQYFLSFSDYIIGIGNEELEAFKGFKKTKLLINPVSFEDYTPAFRKTFFLYDHFKISRDKTIAGVFGQLHCGKGQDFIIKYFIDQSFPNLTLIIFGDGPIRKELEKLVRATNKTDNIIFAGFVTNVYECMESCDFILRAEDQGMLGRDILEANALGLPFITSKNPKIDYSEIVAEGKNGFCFEPHNISQFEEKLSLMLSNYKGMRGFASNNKFGYSDLDTYGSEFAKIIHNIQQH